MTGTPPGDADKDKTGRDRLDEIDDRLEGLRDAVGSSLRDIADRLQAAFGTVSYETTTRAGGVEIAREVRVGSVLDDDGTVIVTPPPETVEPEHTVQLTGAAWTLECHLPGCGPLDVRLSATAERLSLMAGRFALILSLPTDLDRVAMTLSLADGVLRLTAPRQRGRE